MIKIIFDGRKREFKSATGIEKFGPDFANGDGWNCAVNENGHIKCYCSNSKKDGFFETILTISETGSATIMKKKNSTPFFRHRYKIYNWPVNGEIILGGGAIEKRKAFFLETETRLKDWQRKYGISEVRMEEPNGIRTLEFYYFEEDSQFCIEHLETDGEVKFISEDFGKTLDLQEMYPESNSFEHYKNVKVINATWVIITKVSTKESSRILYALTDAWLLKNLPKGPEKLIDID